MRRSAELFAMVCTYHSTAKRRAANALEQMCRDDGNVNHAARFAADLVGPDTLVVIVRDAKGELAWHFLPRA